jgi:protease I
MADPKIAILVESDYYEHEIWYYQFRFREAGIEAHFMSRLWGQPSITFKGHEHQAPLEVSMSFENMSDADLASYSAVIVPSGYVSDRLRYTEDLSKVPPATAFLQRAFANKSIIKGIICHGLWLVAPDASLVRDRRLTCHPNLHGDARADGAKFVDEDVVEDGDLVTARTGNHAHLLAKTIIKRLGRGI